MIENIPLILIVIVIMHVFVIRQINRARDPFRMSLAGRFHKLKESDAPDWLLDFWMVVFSDATFSHGHLKWGILYYLVKPSGLKTKVESFQKKINKLPPELKEIHDQMDRDFAILLLLSSPYFSIILLFFTLIVQGTVELAKVIPARDARGELFTDHKLT